MSRIAILGSGAWGTALALSFSARHSIALWGRETDLQAQLRSSRENPLLPGVKLPASVDVVDSHAEAFSGADLVLVVTPTAGLRFCLRSVAELAPSLPVIWACKGLEVGTGKLPHDIAAEELGAEHPVAVLTGPSFAQEVAAGLPGAVTLAGNSLAFATHWAAQLHHNRLRIYAADDVVGAEVSGAVKNVLAIATGICDGMGFGLNARAALITRGLAEITRLGLALGGRRETFSGLAGVGDLILTCTGDLSRNRRVGLALAEGRKLDEILDSLGHVAEGVPTAREVAALARRLGVDMPITAAVDAVLHEGLPPREAVERLLARDPKIEG
ncbi:NAD(P)H-dependent glycerol-3-phosphate dehydrogenase [Niveibacterium microcysteis]|uniref:Glycerol-3-phosphate dehydrogenase [NAD(P)+] n=1 Tax=Niveibacterium microcysteis TaxID=2811415 RepID=A0ABX7M980_9RHOO|nr:NAD(P)H-dependent glycerol-3-phosphate dehydrogenase [Niveibacterium microcysteis]QSI78291.1 NAD(P)-dependent glycerol-3-phosphate dehydrogenase [Niveibacterium microcysteis]